MKKIATLLLAAGLVFGAATGASAIDFKANGAWLMYFQYGMNGNFQGKYKGHTTPGYKKGEDDFEAQQRLSLDLTAVASENLSGTVRFEIDNDWGKATKGGALGADKTDTIKLKNAYLDWMIPETDVKVRMGIQGIAVPSFTTGSGFVLNDDVAGVSASAKINEMVGVTAFWARPYNDNYTGTNLSGQGARSAYLDNMDAFGLLVPLTFDGVKVTPWGMYAATGPNTFRNGTATTPGDNFLNPGSWDATSLKYTKAGMFPVGGALYRNGSSANNVASRRLNQYGNAWWGGITGEVTMWDPFRLAWDFVYGSSTWDDDGRLNRQGYLMSLLAEYKLDWATPGIYGWYGSGDDSNPSNGSERMPIISAGNSGNALSTYASNGFPGRSREGVLTGGNGAMVGTWGIGARLKDMSFVEKLKHTLFVNYWGGTNSTTMAKKLSAVGGIWANGNVLADGAIDGSLGRDGIYMTTGDSALEFSLINEYKMYENFTISLQASYVALWLDTSKSAWGARHTEGKSIPQTRDAWNLNALFAYTF